MIKPVRNQSDHYLLKILSLVLILLSLPSLVYADGVLRGLWDYVDEKTQNAYINHENGIEKLIISVGTEKSGKEGFVWIVPVPSEPQKIGIDILDSVPILKGDNLSLWARVNVLEAAFLLHSTQIYPVFFYVPMVVVKAALVGDSSGISIHKHIEKKGITIEVITARKSDNLYEYLKGKGLKFGGEGLPSLDYYVGKEYSFVCSWISSPEELKKTLSERQLLNKQRKYYSESNSYNIGLYVSFPTDKIYYPLKPTSAYQNKVIPTTTRVIGHVTPKIFRGIKSYSKIDYFLGEYSETPPQKFHNPASGKMKYTRIEINAPSKFLKDDLWIDKRTPLRSYVLSFIADKEQFLIASILIFILSSLLAGVAAGLYVFPEMRNRTGATRLGLLGLSNCLTILGVTIAAYHLKAKEPSPEIDQVLNELKGRGYIRKRRIAFHLFILSFYFLLLLPISFLSHPAKLISTLLGPHMPIIVISAVIITPIIATILLLNRKEDNPLFERLKSYSYSPTFLIDKRKSKFIVLFSISYLVISSLFVLVFVGLPYLFAS